MDRKGPRPGREVRGSRSDTRAGFQQPAPNPGALPLGAARPHARMPSLPLLTSHGVVLTEDSRMCFQVFRMKGMVTPSLDLFDKFSRPSLPPQEHTVGSPPWGLQTQGLAASCAVCPGQRARRPTLAPQLGVRCRFPAEPELRTDLLPAPSASPGRPCS